MAHLTNCEYCKGRVLDAPWHQECRVAYLEDILLNIKGELRKGTLSSVTIAKVGSENWQTWADFQKRKSELGVRQVKKVLRDASGRRGLLVALAIVIVLVFAALDANGVRPTEHPFWLGGVAAIIAVVCTGLDYLARRRRNGGS